MSKGVYFECDRCQKIFKKQGQHEQMLKQDIVPTGWASLTIPEKVEGGDIAPKIHLVCSYDCALETLNRMYRGGDEE